MSMSLALLMLHPSLASSTRRSVEEARFIHLPHSVPSGSSATPAASALMDLWEVTSTIPLPRDASDMYVAGGSVAAALDQFFETQQCSEWVSRAADYFRSTDASLPIASPPLPAEQLAWGATGDVDLWIRSKRHLTMSNTPTRLSAERSIKSLVSEAAQLASPWTASLGLASLATSVDGWSVRKTIGENFAQYLNWRSAGIKATITHDRAGRLPLQCIVCNKSSKDWRQHILQFDSTFVQAGMHPTHGVHVSMRAMIAVLTRYCVVFLDDGSVADTEAVAARLQNHLRRLEAARRKGFLILHSSAQVGKTASSSQPWMLSFNTPILSRPHHTPEGEARTGFSAQFINRSAWPNAFINATTGFTHLVLTRKDVEAPCDHGHPFLTMLSSHDFDDCMARWSTTDAITVAEACTTAVKQSPILFSGLGETLCRLNTTIGDRTTQRYRLSILLLCSCDPTKPVFIQNGCLDIGVVATRCISPPRSMSLSAARFDQPPSRTRSCAGAGAGAGAGGGETDTSRSPKRRRTIE